MAKSDYPCTVVEFEMFDGAIKMTLQMHGLYLLWARNREVWDEYNRITSGKGDRGEIDTAMVLYAAYLCACCETDVDDRYGSFEEFLLNLPPDRMAMCAAYRDMCAPKKAEPSAMHSKSAPGKRPRKSRFLRSRS